MLKQEIIIQKILNTVVVIAVHGVRAVQYWVTDRSPVLTEFSVSDRVLVNDRILCIRYSCDGVTSICVKGIVRSHRHRDMLIVEVPSGMSVVEIVFYGARNKITERVPLVFLRAAVQKGNFKKSVSTPFQWRVHCLSAALVTLNVFRIARKQILIKLNAKERSVQNTNRSINISYPSIDKSSTL